jgi:hypothetical protein
MKLKKEGLKRDETPTKSGRELELAEKLVAVVEEVVVREVVKQIHLDIKVDQPDVDALELFQVGTHREGTEGQIGPQAIVESAVGLAVGAVLSPWLT